MKELIPIHTASISKDSKIITFTDNTPTNNYPSTGVSNGGYSAYVARAAGSITFNPTSEGTNSYIYHANHGLSTGTPIVILAVSETSRIKKGMLFVVGVIDSNNFRLIKEGGNPSVDYWVHGLVNTPATTFNYVKAPAGNPSAYIWSPKENITFVEVIMKDWENKVILKYQTSINSLFPISSNSLGLLPTDFGYSGDTFSDGIYSFDIRVMALVSAYANANVVPTFKIEKSTKRIYANTNVITSLSNFYLTGIAEYKNLKLVNSADRSINLDCSVKTNVSDSEVIVNEDLSSLDEGETYELYSEYYCTSYVVSKYSTSICFHNSIAQIDMSKDKCCDKCAKDTNHLMCVYKALLAVNIQAELGLYDDANRNLQAAKRLCENKNCCK